MDTNQINFESAIRPALAELWSRYSIQPWTHDEQGPLAPLFPAYALREQILVLGLNPSYNQKHRSLTSYKPDYFSKGYFNRMENFMRQASDKYDALLHQVPEEAYGQLFFSGKLEWSHLDLLYMRTTKQQQLQKDLWATPEAAGFCWEQLQITKKLIARLRPTMIMVANKFGQTLTGFNRDKKTGGNEWMGLQFSDEADEYGMYRITDSTTAGKPDPDGAFGLAGTPVLFTGSFAGTNPRSISKDDALTTQIAAAYIRGGDAHVERWHMNGPDN
ncbi:hypothetical protein [Hymenobacter ruricola]|uniref:Uncharacterized protein n=1 Tax=Hymenobacter ruricola TaxID=2791023 RepID=A0ABS0I1Z2_9BACT|nr:hypothetical protein [Hymenobacter ruricola]MBF9220960.1 hypothetical protein [Hymenobacter ruricola]